MEKKILEDLILENLSQREIANRLGVSQTKIRYWLKKFKIKTNFNCYGKGNTSQKEKKYCKFCKKEIKLKNTYCNSNCLKEYFLEEYIKRWKMGLESGMSGKDSISGFIRRYIFKKYDNKCCKCGWKEINPKTKKIPLAINHIDGDFRNNKENNLELLCPNCHSLTSNYGILNKGMGRRTRIKNLE